MGQGNIIGYEINDKTCQISFYNDQQLEPCLLYTSVGHIRTEDVLEQILEEVKPPVMKRR